jgi:hypothetical protein
VGSESAQVLYEKFFAGVARAHDSSKVKKGVFGAMMQGECLAQPRNHSLGWVELVRPVEVAAMQVKALLWLGAQMFT